jgi:hypothetical protein
MAPIVRSMLDGLRCSVDTRPRKRFRGLDKASLLRSFWAGACIRKKAPREPNVCRFRKKKDG